MGGMRFGVFVPQGWRMDLAGIPDPVEKFETMVRCAQEAEQAGFDAVWLYDHFHPVPSPEHESVFECWTSMAALARETHTIRLGQLVTCSLYRPPSLLAKMASCVDVMSRGRLILGLGAGWYEEEFRAYGYEFPETPERLRMLREAVEVIKAMWGPGDATFEGRYYQVRGAINEPKPVQQPHPPIWIGGGGEKVTLKLVAQYGDACNLGGDVETVRHKLGVLRAHCENVGRDYDSILKTIELYAIFGDAAEVDRVVTEVARRSRRDAAIVKMRYVIGDARYLTEQIKAYRDLGVDYVAVNLPNAAEGGVISRFADDVIASYV